MASIEHLEGHPHAFVDANGVVLNVAAFDNHNEKLISAVMLAQADAVGFVCLCLHGMTSIGSIWDGTTFTKENNDNG